LPRLKISCMLLMGYYLGKAKFEHKKSYYAFHALGVATLFHGAYDYCLFISFVPGIVFGALLSLVVGIWLSRKAIKIHQFASPFRIKVEGEVPLQPVEVPDQKNIT